MSRALQPTATNQPLSHLQLSRSVVAVVIDCFQACVYKKVW